MRIAVVSQFDTKNVHAWSGTPYFIVKTLKERGHEVVEFEPLRIPFAFFVKLARKLHSKFSNKYYDFNRHPLIVKSYAKQISNYLNNEKFDLIFSPSTIPCASLKTKIPIVLWCDATVANMLGYYPGNWSKLCSLAIKQANQVERQALEAASLCIYSSEWAAASAINDYQIPNSKVKVVGFGANLAKGPSDSEVETAINARPQDICRLLFIGVDWKRKGGGIVIDTAIELERRGIKVIVDIVGCEPIGVLHDFMNCHGFISKATPEGAKKIHDLLLAAHFLFVPSEAECYGLVYGEASAYGVQALARATGGVETVVKNGINGYAFPERSAYSEYADYIYSEFTNYKDYKTSAKRAREFYLRNLTWDAAISQFESLTEELIK